MQETWVWSLGGEDSPGGGNGNPLQYACLENPMDRGAWRAAVHGVKRVRHDWVCTHRWSLSYHWLCVIVWTNWVWPSSNPFFFFFVCQSLASEPVKRLPDQSSDAVFQPWDCRWVRTPRLLWRGTGMVTGVNCPVLHEIFSNICALSPLGANSSLPLHVWVSEMPLGIVYWPTWGKIAVAQNIPLLFCKVPSECGLFGFRFVFSLSWSGSWWPWKALWRNPFRCVHSSS